MNTNRTTILLIIFIISTLCCCNKDSEEDINLNLPPNTMAVTNIRGVVGYWENINKYTVNVAVPGTIDSQITGIVDELPSEFRNEGMIVIFSGAYKEEASNPEPILGGQTVYSLTISSIKKK